MFEYCDATQYMNVLGTFKRIIQSAQDNPQQWSAPPQTMGILSDT